jgi:hypothetical protein
VQAVRGVVLGVADVGQRGLHDVLVREVGQPHLRGQDRLAARRQRRVADGDRLVVGEVAQLLLVGEGVAAQEQREHEVGLLDHLLAVELQVGEERVQGVPVLGGAGEVPAWLVEEAGALRVHAELLVIGHEHRVGRPLPLHHLVGGDLQRLRSLGELLRPPVAST